MNNPEKQFSKIYDQYISKIYRFVLLKVSSQEVAEDISSRVFMKGWEIFRKDVDKIENPKAFLYKVARNMVIDHYREKGRTKTVSADAIPNLIPDPRTSIYDRAITNAEMDKVRVALAGLSDDYQNVVIWHYLDDLSIKETAKLLDRSEDATRVLLSRALGSLRERLTS